MIELTNFLICLVNQCWNESINVQFPHNATYHSLFSIWLQIWFWISRTGVVIAAAASSVTTVPGYLSVMPGCCVSFTACVFVPMNLIERFNVNAAAVVSANCLCAHMYLSHAVLFKAFQRSGIWCGDYIACRNNCMLLKHWRKNTIIINNNDENNNDYHN